MSRKGTFSKAIHHLKSTEIDEKIQKLDEQPTNNTMGYMTATPNTPNPDFVHRNQGQFQAQLAKEPDFDADDPDLNGKDTSGLFEEQDDGTVIPRVALPPITNASPDNSYILGPMAAMYYTWSYPWTMIGYIDEDRQMVNMARISGKLSDWDGVSNFNSGTWGGQLTLEQAVWFRDARKKDDAGNDPANANYRAFYPGPPSNAPDAFGRYYCTITGEPLLNYPPLPGIGEKENLPGTGGTGTAEDVLSAIMDRLGRGERLSKREKEFLKKNNKEKVDNLFDKLKDWKGLDGKGKTIGEKINAVKDFVKSIGDFGVGVADGLDTMWDVNNIIKIAERNGNIGPDGEITAGTIGSIEKPMLNQVSDTTAAQILKGVDIGAVNMGIQIQNNVSAAPGVIGGEGTMGAKGIHNNLPNMGWNENDYPVPYVREDGAVVIPDTYKFGPHGFRPAKYSPTGQDETKANVGLIKPGWVVGAVGDIANFFGGDGQKAADAMGTMFDQALPFLPGIPGGTDPTVHFETVIPADQVNRIRNQSNNNQSSNNIDGKKISTVPSGPNSPLPAPGWTPRPGSNFRPEPMWNAPKPGGGSGRWGTSIKLAQNETGGKAFQMPDVKVNDPTSKGSGGSKAFGMRDVKVNDTVKKGSRGSKAFGMPDVKVQPKSGKGGKGKGYKKYVTTSYNPEGQVLSESRKTILKNLHEPVVLPETKQKSYKIRPRVRKSIKVGTNPNIAKPAKTPKEFRSNLGSPATWGQFEYNRNVRSSQSKKNKVLDLIGSGHVAFDYMLTDSKQLNAEQLEKFWGLHPELYSYFYNGKKYKAIRKEQVKGDYIVFLIDEDGRKSNILQSVLNEKLGEEQEMKDLAEYNRLHPKEPVSYEKDPLVTKSGPTVKDVAKRLKNLVDYEGRPATKGYPNEPPPKMVNGFHPKLGKNYKYDKLDPVSARAMPMQDNPEIDANIEKARQQPVIEPGKKPKRIPIKMKKEQFSNWRTEEKEKIQEASTTSNTFYNSLPSAGDEDLVVMQAGGSGDLTIDLGGPGSSDNKMKNSGEGNFFAHQKWFADIEDVDDPHETGKWVKGPQMGGLGSGGGHGYTGTIPGYKTGMMRNYQYTGDWSNTHRDWRHQRGLPQLQGDHTQAAFWARWGPTVHPDHELGTKKGTWGQGDNADRPAIVNGKEDWGFGTVLGCNMSSWPRYLSLKAIDSTEFDTFKLHASVRADSIIEPGTQVRLFYWSGDKPGFQKSRPGHAFASNPQTYDGWRPIYQKPNGEIDTDYTDVIIPTSRPPENDDVTAAYSVKLPPWTRDKNTSFMIFQYDATFSARTDHYLVSMRFQRKEPMTVGAPLDGPEGSSFIRVGQRGAEKTTPQQRQKKIEDMLQASREYLMKNLGYTDFPGMGATLSKIAASSTSFGDVFQQHMDTLSPEDQKAFEKERKARKEKTRKSNTNKKSKGKSRSSRSGNYDVYNVVR